MQCQQERPAPTCARKKNKEEEKEEGEGEGEEEEEEQEEEESSCRFTGRWGIDTVPTGFQDPGVAQRHRAIPVPAPSSLAVWTLRHYVSDVC